MNRNAWLTVALIVGIFFAIAAATGWLQDKVQEAWEWLWESPVMF